MPIRNYCCMLQPYTEAQLFHLLRPTKNGTIHPFHLFFTLQHSDKMNDTTTLPRTGALFLAEQAM